MFGESNSKITKNIQLFNICRRAYYKSRIVPYDVFGIMQMVSPGTLLEQYKLDMGSVSNVESNIFNMLNTQGWNLFSSAALASMTIRKNDPNTVSAMFS